MKVTKKFEKPPLEKYYIRFYNETLQEECFIPHVDKFEAVREKNRLLKMPHMKNVVLFEYE